MQDRASLYDLLDYEAYNHFDTSILQLQRSSLDDAARRENLRTSSFRISYQSGGTGGLH